MLALLHVLQYYCNQIKSFYILTTLIDTLSHLKCICLNYKHKELVKQNTTPNFEVTSFSSTKHF